MRMKTTCLLLIYLLGFHASAALAQQSQTPSRQQKTTRKNFQPDRQGSAPTKSNVPYGDHDPIAKQSTRMSCVFPINMQSTYDPRDIKRIIPGKAYKHSALVAFFGRPAGWDWDTDPIDDELDKLLKDASPVNHLTRDDAPIFLLQYARAATPGNIHHPKFGEHLKREADARGVECVAKLDTDYKSISDAYTDMVKFMQTCFQRDR